MFIGMSTITAPVHEAGHWLCAWNRDQEAKIIDWSHTVVEWEPQQIYAGALFETIVWAFIAMLAAKKRVVFSFVLGLSVGAWLSWYFGSDLSVYAVDLMENMGVKDIAATKRKLILRWTLIGPAVFAGPLWVRSYFSSG
jgi:hypothetical protein